MRRRRRRISRSSATPTRRWRSPGAIPIRGRRRRWWRPTTRCVTRRARVASRRLETGAGIARLNSVAVAGGPHVVKVWLQDEAGNADSANAAVADVRPVHGPGAACDRPQSAGARPRPRAPDASRHERAAAGSTLTLTGTIARAATARITAKASRSRRSSALASARTKPRRGSWTLAVKLTSALRRSNAFYVTVSFAGQKAFSGSTIRRRLAKRPPRPGSSTDEFSLEARSGR